MFFKVVLIILVGIFIANNSILFIGADDIGSYTYTWIINSVLYGLLALMYLVTFCYLAATMNFIASDSLH